MKNTYFFAALCAIIFCLLLVFTGWKFNKQKDITLTPTSEQTTDEGGASIVPSDTLGVDYSKAEYPCESITLKETFYYVLGDVSDPFEELDTIAITPLETKKGYVRYKMGTLYRSCPCDYFNRWYAEPRLIINHRKQPYLQNK